MFLVHDCGDTDLLPENRKIKITCHVNPEFSPIIFSAFGQLAAEYIASSAGYDVDGFRYLSKIVRNY